jgi:hypothetical protein
MPKLILDKTEIRSYYSNLPLNQLYDLCDIINGLQEPSTQDLMVLETVTDELDRREMEMFI